MRLRNSLFKAFLPINIKLFTKARRGPNLLTIYASIILFAISTTSNAFDPSSDLPIQIESDSANLNDETGIAVYSGNVIISQGLSRLEAHTISVNAIDHELVSIKAVGSPAHFVQQLDEKSPATHGYGDHIIYVAKEQVLKFLGSAKLVQEDNSFSGNEIEYDIVGREIKARGDHTTGSRVKIQYKPPHNEESTPK